VPNSLREASYGMGARKVTTSVRVVIPAAVSGLVAAFIVAISRAIGETMVVFIAAGASGGALFTMDPFQEGLTMTAAMASMAAGTDNVVGEALTFQSLFFVGMLLFAITMSLNLFADRFVRRVRQKY
jgi:phosphate transport system permease protein